MHSAHQKTCAPSQAMQDDWQEWHAKAIGEVPQVSLSFEKAWKVQQNRVEELARKLRVTQFAIHSAAEVLANGTPQEMRDAAGFLTAIKRITQHD